MDTESITDILKGKGDRTAKGDSFVEAMGALQRSLADWDDTFEKLPTFQRIREKWKANGISDDDAAWIIIEAQSTADQRGQMREMAMVRLISAHAQVMKFSVSECARIVDSTIKLESSVATMNTSFPAMQDQMKRAGTLLDSLCKAIGPLIDYVHRAMKMLEDRTIKAALLQVGIIVSTAVGVLCLERLLKFLHLW